MNRKDYWKYQRTITRKDLLIFGLLCSFPPFSWIALIYVVLCKPHNEKKKNWKLPPTNNIPRLPD